jgi:hypothetical protein
MCMNMIYVYDQVFEYLYALSILQNKESIFLGWVIPLSPNLYPLTIAPSPLSRNHHPLIITA